MSNEKIIPSWPAQHASERARWCIMYLGEHHFITASEHRKLKLRLFKTLTKVQRDLQKAAAKAEEAEKRRVKQAVLEAEEG